MSTDTVTVKQASALLVLLAAGGLRVPDVYHQPAEDGAPTGRVVMARMWAAALNKWGITYTEAEAAVSDYLAEPDAGQYPKAWPDPGKIVARTPVGRRALELGTDEDCDRAWSVFRSRMMGLLPDGPAAWQDIANGEAAGRAFLAGLAAMGGTDGFRMARPEDPWPVKAWKEGYRAERKRQAVEPREVRKMLPANEPKMLESGK